MYYISEFENNCVLSLKKKRLGDFKGEEGARYHARRGAWAVKEKFLPVVREPWGVGRGEGVAIFG
jgi:hypothetical protein